MSESTTYTEAENTWTWRSRKNSSYVLTGRIDLYWEVNGDPVSDDYFPSETTADELLRIWMKRLPDAGTEGVFGPGAVGISWFVHSKAIFEAAPFQMRRLGSAEGEEDFFTNFTWPEHTETGERLNFNRLPVLDKRWNDDGGGQKGGFIQEATGWKPSPLQPVMWIGSVLAGAGLSGVDWIPRRVDLRS